MKKYLLAIISLLIGLGLFYWIANLIGWQEIKNALLLFTGLDGLAIFGLTLLMMLIGIWRWNEILLAQGANINFRKLITPYFAGFAVMFLAPTLIGLGEAFRGYIIKNRHDIPWPKAVTSVFIDRILEWTVNLAVISLGVLFFILKMGLPPKNISIVFGAAFLFFLSFMIFFYSRAFRGKSSAEFFLKISGLNKFNLGATLLDAEEEIFNFFKSIKKFFKALILSVFMAITAYIRTWLLIVFLGKNIGFISSLSILGFTYLAAMIPLPGSLGTHEALQIFSFKALELGVSTATAFTLVIRGAEFILVLLGLGIILSMGMIFFKNFLSKHGNKIINKEVKINV
jgi:uncharacterized protein (TIRG00374 family)